MNLMRFAVPEKRRAGCKFFAALFTLTTLATALLAQEADLIVHHGKIVTVDRDFSVRQAMAIKNGLILRVGTDEEVLRLKGSRTELIDLAGKMVLPGLMDSHTHPLGAALTEFDHEIPTMESIADVLASLAHSVPLTLGLFRALDVFREGAENGTPGACAPHLSPLYTHSWMPFMMRIDAHAVARQAFPLRLRCGQDSFRVS